MEAPEPQRGGPAGRAGPAEPQGGGPGEAQITPDARLAAIVAEGRATRRRPSRAMWIAAAIIGAICAVGFVLLLFPRGEPAARPAAAEPSRPPPRGAGCLGGLGIGIGIGIGIGFWLACRQERDHSSRRRP